MIRQPCSLPLLLVVFLFHAHNGMAQAGLLPIASVYKDTISLAGIAEYALATNDSTGLSSVSRLAFRATGAALGNARDVPAAVETIWLRFSVHSSGTDSLFVLYTRTQVPLMYLYKEEHGSLVETGRSGEQMPHSRRSLPGDSKRIPFSLQQGRDAIFYLCYQRYHDRIGFTIPIIQTREAALFAYEDEREQGQQGRIFQFFFAGFFFAIFVYSLLKYFSRAKDKVYLIYGLNNLCCCLAITVYFNFPDLESAWWPWLRNNIELCTVLSAGTIVFRILFLRRMLDLRTHALVFFRVTQAYICFHLLATVLAPMLAAGPHQLLLGKAAFILYSTAVSLYWMLSLYTVAYLWRRRTGFYQYLFYAECSMAFGMTLFAVASIFLNQGSFIAKDGQLSGYLFMLVFIIGESWLCIRALAQRERQAEQSLKESLETLIEERGRKLMEQQALRSQMNPHFIFNTLNSIENFMMKNDKMMTSEYFGKFTSLIRTILDNSRHELVAFEKDMETLDIYIDLELLRFEHFFSYRKVVDPALLNTDYRVPPLIIQPYVENAITHGLRLSDNDNPQLLITVALEDGFIVYSIQDNGIGRQRSALFRERDRNIKESLGLRITEQRITMFNHQHNATGQVTIIDLYDEYDEPAGTRVTLKLIAV